MHRVLELAQAVEFLLRLALLVLARVGKILLRVPDLLIELGGAEILERNCGLREKDEAEPAGFGEAAADEDAVVLAGRVVDGDHAGTHRGHHRRMVAQHLKVALVARHDHRLRPSAEQHLVRRHEFEGKRAHAT